MHPRAVSSHLCKLKIRGCEELNPLSTSEYWSCQTELLKRKTNAQRQRPVTQCSEGGMRSSEKQGDNWTLDALSWLEVEHLPFNVKPRERGTVEPSWALWHVRLRIYIVVHVPSQEDKKIIHGIDFISLFVHLSLDVICVRSRFVSCSVLLLYRQERYRL